MISRYETNSRAEKSHFHTVSNQFHFSGNHAFHVDRKDEYQYAILKASPNKRVSIVERLIVFVARPILRKHPPDIMLLPSNRARMCHESVNNKNHRYTVALAYASRCRESTRHP